MITDTKGNPARRLYFVGIKGVAMTALAVIAKESGLEVGGTDVSDVFPTDAALAQAGITPDRGFNPGLIVPGTVDAVIYTGAHQGRDNPVVAAALKQGVPVYPHGRALGLVMEGHRQISVSGCHGKTTTTAMISVIGSVLGIKPSYAVGVGSICPLGLPGHAGDGSWFIAEADEYVTDPGHDRTPRLQWQKPDVLVVTNVDYDHPDVYSSVSEIQTVYRKFARTVPSDGTVVINADDANSTCLSDLKTVVSVGFGKHADFRIGQPEFSRESTRVSLAGPDGTYRLTVRVPGRHNVVNGAMAFVAGLRAWGGYAGPELIAGALSKFCGSERRFQLIGKGNGVVFYDDYAHHPHEIQATLSAARTWYPKNRLIAVFEPHTYSRTKALFDEFAASFTDADMVLITDIYASAREHETLGVSSRGLADAASRHHNAVRYMGMPADVAEYLSGHLQTGDVVVFMGAGAIYTWGREATGRYLSQCGIKK